MFQNYIKITLRTVLKNRTYSLVNILGLAIGIFSFLIIFSFVKHELSYDRFHKNADRIFRVCSQIDWFGETSKGANTSANVAPNLSNDFPEIESTVRILFPFTGEALIKHEMKAFYENRFAFADSTFFDVFSLRLIEGNPANILTAPYSVVVTESIKRKYFGDESPIGKEIEFVQADKKNKYIITGVMEDVPSNSHLRFDFIASFSNLYKPEWVDDYDLRSWYSMNFATYVLLKDKNDYEILNKKLPGFVEKHTGGSEGVNPVHVIYFLQPLKEIYLYSNFTYDFARTGSIGTIKILTALAIFLLIIAGINFMNLTTARFSKRLKEIGVRKVIGAARIQLVKQFLGESLIITFFSMLIALLIYELTTPLIKNLIKIDFEKQLFSGWEMILFITGTVVLLGILSGSYPALYLSKFKPVSVLKSSFSTVSDNINIRKVLVIFQFMISAFLVIATLIMNDQFEYIQNKDLGFNHEHVMVIPLRSSESRSRSEILKTNFQKNSQFLSSSLASGFPGYFGSRTTFKVSDTKTDPIFITTVAADMEFLSTLKLKIKEGRNFSDEFGTDLNGTFILNETAVKELALEDPIGTRLTSGWGGMKGNVVGIINDFHFQSLHNRMGPMVLAYVPARVKYLLIKTTSRDITSAIESAREEWNKFTSAEPFDYFFLDDKINDLYKSEYNFAKIVNGFSILAVFIACMGLFGLVVFATEQRIKEIGVRKVLGASLVNIVQLLSREFLKMVLIANVLAVPIIYYVISKWLENFAYKAEISFTTFISGFCILILIAVVTLSYHSIRAAISNPVEALRYE